MLSSHGLFVPLNGLADWQCRYSGCTRPRHRKWNGAFLRFCNMHRLRQNEHQRAFIQRCRRGEARRMSRAWAMQTTDIWTKMELDYLFTDDVEANRVGVDRPFTDSKTPCPQGDASIEPPSTLEELLLVPVGSIEDLLDYLPAPDS
jgi:hypothetical protein